MEAQGPAALLFAKVEEQAERADHLMALAHLINHKFQLFCYLKLMGLPVATPDLYRLAEAKG